MPYRFTGLRAFCAASVLVLALGTALALLAAFGPERGKPTSPATVGERGPIKDRAAPAAELTYRAAPGQNNRVTVTESLANAYWDTCTYVIDDVVRIAPGVGDASRPARPTARLQ